MQYFDRKTMPSTVIYCHLPWGTANEKLKKKNIHSMRADAFARFVGVWIAMHACEIVRGQTRATNFIVFGIESLARLALSLRFELCTMGFSLLKNYPKQYFVFFFSLCLLIFIWSSTKWNRKRVKFDRFHN